MLNYIDIGENNEEAIVLIHGLSNVKEMWNRQYELSKHYRLIVLELRGHGNSTTTDNLNVETYADDIVELLDYLQLDKVHFCGISLGAITLLEFHKRYKERIKSLILVNTTFHVPSFIGHKLLGEQRKLLNSIGYDEYAKLSMKVCLHNQDFDDELVDKCFKIREDTYIEASKSAFGRNYLMELTRIKVPTLVIGSSEDKLTPKFNAFILNNMISNSRIKIFNECGHLSNVEKWEEFNEAVKNHIANVD